MSVVEETVWPPSEVIVSPEVRPALSAGDPDRAPAMVTPLLVPLPLLPLPFARQKLTEEMLTHRTPEAHKAALERFRQIRSNGQFAPPSLVGTVIFPGFVRTKLTANHSNMLFLMDVDTAVTKIVGAIERGKQADLTIWNVPASRQIPYWPAADLVRTVVKRGRVVLDRG